MSKKIDTRLAMGILLILFGGLYLLLNLGILTGTAANIFWTVLLGAGGAYFLALFLSRKAQWWAAIPGVTLLGLALSELLDFVLPEVAATFDGLIVLGSIGLSFWVVYFTHRRHWWAVIPGGVLVTLGVIDLADEVLTIGMDTGGLLFVGMGLTFLVVYFLPTPIGRMRWALYPAVPLLVFGAFVAFGDTAMWSYLWPFLVIGFGLYFLWTAVRRE